MKEKKYLLTWVTWERASAVVPCLPRKHSGAAPPPQTVAVLPRPSSFSLKKVEPCYYCFRFSKVGELG